MTCCRSPRSWRRSPESTPSLGTKRPIALKIAQSHAVRGNAPHAIDHLTRACRDLDEAALLFLAKLHRQQGQDEQALAIWRELRQNNCVAGIEALAKYHEHVTRELEAALELAEELLRLEPASEFHAKRRDRLRQRLARSRRRRHEEWVMERIVWSQTKYR